MSETISVPLEGANVVNQGVEAQPQPQPERESGFKDGVYVPPSKRVSIHQTRMPRSAAVETETAPQWTGQRFEWKPVERPAEPTPTTAPPSTQPNDAISQQIGQLTNTVELLARHQLGLPLDDKPQMPNAAAYDFYDPQQEGEYHQAMREYMDAEWQRRKQAEIEPYMPALTNIQKQQEMESQFNELVAAHGEDKNFRTVMASALQMVADSPNQQLSIKDAYAKADSRDNRPGERGGHLPKALTQGKFPRFGEILLHNQMSGRSGRR